MLAVQQYKFLIKAENILSQTASLQKKESIYGSVCTCVRKSFAKII